jgi:hypothetical protein
VFEAILKRKEVVMRIFGWFALFMVIISCDNSNPKVVVPLLPSDFSPVRVGAYFIYGVDETKIQFNVSTNLNYEIKVMATDSFRNEGNGITYVLSRFKRTDNTKPWTPQETWSMRQDVKGLVISEGNTAYLKLSQSLFSGQQWDGNVYNNLGGAETCGATSSVACDIYRIESIGIPYVASGKTYDSSLVVVQSNDPDILVTNDVRKEIYAKGVGLVYRELTVLNYCTEPPSCYATQFVNSGVRYKQTLKEYGME